MPHNSCLELAFPVKHILTFIMGWYQFSYDGEKSTWLPTSPPQYRYDYDSANMALYNGKPVLIGAFGEKELSDFDDKSLWRSNASYFEVFDNRTEEWSDLKRNPFFPEGTHEYWGGTSVTKEDSFIIFGGTLDVYQGKNFTNK